MVGLDTPCHPDKELLEKYCSWVRHYVKLMNRLKQFDLTGQSHEEFT